MCGGVRFSVELQLWAADTGTHLGEVPQRCMLAAVPAKFQHDSACWPVVGRASEFCSILCVLCEEGPTGLASLRIDY